MSIFLYHEKFGLIQKPILMLSFKNFLLCYEVVNVSARMQYKMYEKCEVWEHSKTSG